MPHVRDLRNRVHPRHRRPRQARGDERNPRPARAGLGRRVRRGACRARSAAPRDHRPRDGRPADLERGRADHGRPERRALQLSRAPPGARAGRAPVLDERRHRGARPPLRGARRALRGAAARHVRRRALGRGARPARARARPVRDQAALLPRRRAGRSSSPPSCGRFRAARSTSTRSTRSSPSTPFPGR